MIKNLRAFPLTIAIVFALAMLPQANASEYPPGVAATIELYSPGVIATTKPGQPVTVDFGDGSPLDTFSVNETSPSNPISHLPHQFPYDGEFKPTFTCQAATLTLDFTVTHNPDGFLHGIGITSMSVIIPQSPTDPYGFNVIPSYAINSVTGGSIDFGDGSPPVAVTADVLNQHIQFSHVYPQGTFTAMITLQGMGYTHTGKVLFTNGTPPTLKITDFNVTLNHPTAGTPTLFTGVFDAKSAGTISGSLDFGDGTAPEALTGDVAAALKTGISHTYASDGIFPAVLSLQGTVSAVTKLYVIVGGGSVVNPNDELGVHATDVNGVVTLSILSGLGSVTDASTDFLDSSGHVLASAQGFNVSNTFLQNGIFVAKVSAHAGAVDAGKVRKMLNISKKDVGDSSALPDPPSADITVLKLQGKLGFDQDTPDTVSFSGSIKLPAGLNPAGASGNQVFIGIGNVIDSAVVDAKGKGGASAAGFIKKLKVTYPKLNGQLTVGGETAKVDLTLSLPNIEQAGLDTDGITSSLRADERNLKVASRDVQVDLQIAGVAYETLAGVSYKLSKPNKTTGVAPSGIFKRFVGHGTH